MKIASLASIESRSHIVGRVVQSLLNQTEVLNQINVYCNDWDGNTIPKHPSVIIHEHVVGDLGDVGKLFGINRGYNFLCDDDIIYPKNYVSHLRSKIDFHQKIVGVHGVILNPVVENYFKDRKVIHFRSQSSDTPVHLIGTGTFAYHSKFFEPALLEIDKQNMTDCYLAVQAQEQKVGMVCVSRPSMWLKDIKIKDTLWATRGDGGEQTEVINRINNWKFYE